MASSYLMGVDVGTQSAKVMITDLNGNVVCDASHPLKKIVIPAPQLAEHPDDDLWDALQCAFKAVMARFKTLGGKETQIQAMGVCVIRCCLALLKADGTLAYPVISWMDKRLNAPRDHQTYHPDARYATTSSGYITHRLTGEFRDTCANYIGWWPMDDDALTWSRDPEVIQSCKVPENMLFDVVKPGEVLGYVTREVARATGVPEGLPVVATAHDKAVEALGAGSLEKGTGLISLGTYIGVLVNGSDKRKGGEGFWTFQSSVPGRYIHECMGVRRGMWTVSWFCEEFGAGLAEKARDAGLSIEEWFNLEAEKVPPGCEGLVTVHDWAPPVDATYRKGVMFGFDGRHTRAHMYRSVLEGIALTVKNSMDRMNEELGVPLRRMIVSGGGANSDLFMQIFSDVFGVPAVRNRVKGSAAIGCVINAGMAAGVFDSYEEAVEKMVHVDDEFQPCAEHTAFYQRLNDRVFRHVHDHFDPVLKPLSELVD